MHNVGQTEAAGETDKVDVFHRLLDSVGRVVEGDEAALEQLIGLYAVPTEVTHPLGLQGDEVLRTPMDLRTHFIAAARMADDVERFQAVNRVVHVTDDPEVVIGQFDYSGVVGGRDFTFPCIFVVRVRDGRIVQSQDYVDVIGSARAFSRIVQLGDALAGRA